MFLLLTGVDSSLNAKIMLYAATYILLRVKRHLLIYCRKAFGEFYDIKIAIDCEMKLKIDYMSIFIGNLVRYLGLYT